MIEGLTRFKTGKLTGKGTPGLLDTGGRFIQRNLTQMLMSIAVRLDIMTGGKGLFPKGPVGDRGDRDEPIGRPFRRRQNTEGGAKIARFKQLPKAYGGLQKAVIETETDDLLGHRKAPIKGSNQIEWAITRSKLVHLGVARRLRGVLEPDLEVDEGGVAHRLGRRAEGVQQRLELSWASRGHGINDLPLLTAVVAGQLSLGSAGFMAAGAFACYNLILRVPGIPFVAAVLLSGLIAAGIGILFGLPSLRIRGLYLAVATLASQFFIVWALDKFGWFKNYDSSGIINAQAIVVFGHTMGTPAEKYLVVFAIVATLALLAANMAAGSVGRGWMAVRDMDVAAEARVCRCCAPSCRLLRSVLFTAA